jgi:hypothetical protein
MLVEDLEVGSTYYRFYVSKGRTPIVETWVYRGYKKLSSNSNRCDMPYFFYQFELYSANIESTSIVNFPNKAEVEHSMKEWGDFLEAANEELDDVSEL